MLSGFDNLKSKIVDGGREYFKKNKKMVFMLPVLAVLIVVLIITYSGVLGGKKSKPKPIQASESMPGPEMDGKRQVEVLPQVTRSVEPSKEDSSVLKDPFKSPLANMNMILKGIFENESGLNYAIIEADGTSYVVKTDDTIGAYKVISVGNGKVLLDSDGKISTLDFTQKKNSAN